MAVPAIIAQIDPSLQGQVDAATAAVATAVIVTAIVTPVITSYAVKKFGSPKYPKEQIDTGTK